LASEGVLF
jgi:hypothetical protein